MSVRGAFVILFEEVIGRDGATDEYSLGREEGQRQGIQIGL